MKLLYRIFLLLAIASSYAHAEPSWRQALLDNMLGKTQVPAGTLLPVANYGDTRHEYTFYPENPCDNSPCERGKAPYHGWCKSVKVGKTKGFHDMNSNYKYDGEDKVEEVAYWVWYEARTNGILLDSFNPEGQQMSNPTAKQVLDELLKNRSFNIGQGGLGDACAVGMENSGPSGWSDIGPSGSDHAVCLVIRGPWAFVVSITAQGGTDWDEDHAAKGESFGSLTLMDDGEFNQVMEDCRAKMADEAVSLAGKILSSLDDIYGVSGQYYPPDIRPYLPQKADWIQCGLVLDTENSYYDEDLYDNALVQYKRPEGDPLSEKYTVMLEKYTVMIKSFGPWSEGNDTNWQKVLDITKGTHDKAKGKMKKPKTSLVPGADRVVRFAYRQGDDYEKVAFTSKNVYVEVSGFSFDKTLAPNRAMTIAKIIGAKLAGYQAVIPKNDRPVENKPRNITISCPVKEIRADGVSKFKLAVKITDSDNKPVNSAVVDIVSPGDSIEPIGPFATNGNGLVEVECKVRERLLKGESIPHVLIVSHKYGDETIKAEVPLTLLPMQQVLVQMRDLTGQPAPNEKLTCTVTKIPPGTLVMDYETEQTIWTDEKGEISLPYPECTEISLLYKSPPYATAMEKATCPAKVQILRADPDTATQEIRKSFGDFLRKAGVSEDQIKGLMELPIQYSAETKIIVNELTHTVQRIEIPAPEAYVKSILEHEKNLCHEMGHWLSAAVLDTDKSAGESHSSIWEPCSTEVNAFEEGEAHFLAAQYISSVGRVYDLQIMSATEAKNVPDGKAKLTEGSIAAFLNAYYDPKSSKLTPDRIAQDFGETMAASPQPIRTVDDFIAAKKAQQSGFVRPAGEIDFMAAEYKLR